MKLNEMIDVMKAFENGELIEAIHKTKGVCWAETPYPAWNWQEFDYRVYKKELETNYKPFKNVDDLLSVIGKHDYHVRFKRDIFEDRLLRIYVNSNNEIFVYPEPKGKVGYEIPVSLETLFKNYTFPNGEPCGQTITCGCDEACGQTVTWGCDKPCGQLTTCGCDEPCGQSITCGYQEKKS